VSWAFACYGRRPHTHYITTPPACHLLQDSAVSRIHLDRHAACGFFTQAATTSMGLLSVFLAAALSLAIYALRTFWHLCVVCMMLHDMSPCTWPLEGTGHAASHCHRLPRRALRDIPVTRIGAACGGRDLQRLLSWTLPGGALTTYRATTCWT